MKCTKCKNENLEKINTYMEFPLDKNNIISSAYQCTRCSSVINAIESVNITVNVED